MSKKVEAAPEVIEIALPQRARRGLKLKLTKSGANWRSEVVASREDAFTFLVAAIAASNYNSRYHGGRGAEAIVLPIDIAEAIRDELDVARRLQKALGEIKA